MLPIEYRWLEKEPGPRMLLEALKLYGTEEVVGTFHNTEILDWADEIGCGKVYSNDEIPWCGLFVGVVAHRAGKPIPANPLWARNWNTWGEKCDAELGCVLVFGRDGGGHVGLYVGEDDQRYYVLGGNQGNKVCIKPIDKDRLLACRSLYAVGKPPNVRKIKLTKGGEPSRNEQ